jgi:hypothetical protein
MSKRVREETVTTRVPAGIARCATAADRDHPHITRLLRSELPAPRLRSFNPPHDMRSNL